MHIVIAVLGILTAVYFFVIRARNAAEMTSELMDMAGDVRAAARRLGFSRRKAQHPVDAIEDPNTAAATVAAAFAELHGLPTEETRARILRAMQSTLEIDLKEAEEQLLLGRWLMTQCQGPEAAVARASRKLCKLTGGEIGPLLDLLTAAASTPLSDKQRDALDDVKTAFRIR